MTTVSRCEACRLKPVCKYTDALSETRKKYDRVFNVECMYFDLAASHLVPEEEESDFLVCERCGKKTDRLVKCETCHKSVCPGCAESEQELDVNTGSCETKTVCRDCWEA